MTMPADRHRRSVPAPDLRETADVWFDSGHDPVVTWDAEGRRFELVDPAGGGRLLVYEAPQPARDAAALARVLASSLAACDFPPTGTSAAPSHVLAALRANGVDPDAP
jgi:hypothetical protein